MRILEEAGYLEGGAWRESRRLIVEGIGPAVRCLIAKPVDLLTYVEHGAADLGIVGKDVLLEQGRDVYELVDLGYGTCRGVLAFPGRLAAAWERIVPLRIATKYPRVTERHFGAQGRPVEVIAMSGTVELAPLVGLADGIMDLVMSGRTLRENGLVEVAELFQSTARLVVNRISLRSRAAEVAAVIERVRSVVAAPGLARPPRPAEPGPSRPAEPGPSRPAEPGGDAPPA
jgi:ATP phosphoribosyltransferase